MQAYRTRCLTIALGGALALAASMDCLHAASPYGTTPSMQYFGRRQSLNTPRRQLSQQMPAPQRVQLGGSKPFKGLRRRPTLSPYLNLDVRESELGIPNYHAFVRPMQLQQQAELDQATHLRKLQQRVRVATAQGIVSNNPTGGVPTTGHSSQFLNTGGYFSTTR